MFSNLFNGKQWFTPMVTVLMVGFILGLLMVTSFPVVAQGPADDGVQRGLDATAARYTAMAVHYSAIDDADLLRVRQAETARYNALADYYTPQFTMR